MCKSPTNQLASTSTTKPTKSVDVLLSYLLLLLLLESLENKWKLKLLSFHFFTTTLIQFSSNRKKNSNFFVVRSKGRESKLPYNFLPSSRAKGRKNVIEFFSYFFLHNSYSAKKRDDNTICAVKKLQLYELYASSMKYSYLFFYWEHVAE